ALWRDSPQRILGDDLGQDHVVVGIGRIGHARGEEAYAIAGVDVAAAGKECGTDLVDVLDDDGLEGHLGGAEIVGEIEFGGAAGRHADGRAVQLPGALYAELLWHHEA